MSISCQIMLRGDVAQLNHSEGGGYVTRGYCRHCSRHMCVDHQFCEVVDILFENGRRVCGDGKIHAGRIGLKQWSPYRHT